MLNVQQKEILKLRNIHMVYNSTPMYLFIYFILFFYGFRGTRILMGFGYIDELYRIHLLLGTTYTP